MYIQSLELKNFRKFESGSFRFHPGFTVIIGKNASGKTQILDAVAIILGTFQSKLLRSHNSVRDIRGEEIRIAAYEDPDFRVEEQYPVHIESDLYYFEKPYHVQRIKTSAKGRTAYGGANPLFTILNQQVKRVQDGQPETLPLFAYYGIGRAQHLKRHSAPSRKAYSRFDGYEDSLDPNSDLKKLQDWVADQQYASLQQKKETLALQLLTAAFQKMIPQCEQVYYDVMRKNVYLRFRKEDGTQELCPYANLSDGFRCMSSMVMDIVRRIVLLNPHLKMEALTKTPGVVLIDELDLFLHPEWQRKVVGNLKSVFPAIQFIVTTHSPFILQSLEANEALDLESTASDELCSENAAFPAPENAYSGRSIEDITEDVMQVKVPQWSQKRLDMYATAMEYYRLLNSGEEAPEQLKEKLDKLSAPFSDEIAYHAFLEMNRLAKEGQQ